MKSTFWLQSLHSGHDGPLRNTMYNVTTCMYLFNDRKYSHDVGYKVDHLKGLTIIPLL